MLLGWAIVVFIVCLVVIFFAADFVLDGIEELGEIWKVPTIILAYILIGIDLEETVASWSAALNGLPHIAVGNVIGNTIISICFCFALPAIFFEISFEKIHKWILLSLPIFGLWIILYLIFPQLRIVFGILAILSYVGFVVINIVSKDPLKATEFEETEEDEEKLDDEDERKYLKKRIWKPILFFVIGIVALYFASKWLINSTHDILNAANIEEGVFGLVIIAAGTNVEEYMLLFKSIKRKTPEIGLGGLIGKIIWNNGITFGVSLLLMSTPSAIPLTILMNGILFVGVIIPTLIIIALSYKKLNWKSSIPLLTLLCIYIVFSFIF
ncbi:MAG: sodium:calcium antiporter [Promethearchaeota archaeon]